MFKLLKKIKEFLSGKKTYFVAVGSISALVVAYLNGAIGIVELMEGIAIALGGITLAAKINRGTPA